MFGSFSLPSVYRNGKWASAIIIIQQITNSPPPQKFGSLLFLVSTEMEKMATILKRIVVCPNYEPPPPKFGSLLFLMSTKMEIGFSHSEK